IARLLLGFRSSIDGRAARIHGANAGRHGSFARRDSIDRVGQIRQSEDKVTMEKRKLGRSGPEITTIGFGAWAAGGPWKVGWGPQSDADSIAAIHRSLELGCNWIDTAAIYGLGHSEVVVGQAIQAFPRSEVIIAT